MMAQHIGAVARRLLGNPNEALSTSNQWRYGKHGSLAVDVGGDKRGTWFDHQRGEGGGILDLVRDKLGLSNGAAVEWLKSELGIRVEPASQRRMVATYNYRDESGELLFQVCRFEPKDFRQRRPDGNGGWTWSVKGIRPVPYGWCHVISLAGIGITLASAGKDGTLVETDAARRIIDLIRRLGTDIVMFDPFIKLSDADENDNRASDFVARILVRIAIETDVAVLVAHHFRKGLAEAGNIDAARGARAIIDASRSALTLLPMSGDEAKRFGINEQERRRLVRMDDGKNNLVLAAEAARWYRLASVPIGNATDDYPHGDNVQAVERWQAPDIWDGLSHALLNRILDDLDAGLPDGERYSAAPSARKRAAWRVVQEHAPDKTEAQYRQVIATWLGTGLLKVEEYDSPNRREKAEGVVVDPSKRPSGGAR